METLDLDDFQHNAVNLTTVRLVKRDSGFVADMMRQMEGYENTLLKKDLHILNSSGIISVSDTKHLDTCDSPSHCLQYCFRCSDGSSAHVRRRLRLCASASKRKHQLTASTLQHFVRIQQRLGFWQHPL